MTKLITRRTSTNQMQKSRALETCVKVKLFSEINPLQLNNAKLQNQGEMGQGTLPRCRGTAI